MRLSVLLAILPAIANVAAANQAAPRTVALFPPGNVVLSSKKSFANAEADLAHKIYNRLGEHEIVTMEVDLPCEVAGTLSPGAGAEVVSEFLSCFSELPDYLLLVTYAETESRIALDARIVDAGQRRAAQADDYILREEFLLDGVRANHAERIAEKLWTQFGEAGPKGRSFSGVFLVGIALTNADYDARKAGPVADQDYENRGKTGLRAGATASLRLSPRFAVESGVIFEERGGKTRFPEDGSTIHWRLNYVTLPLCVKMPLNRTLPRFYVKAGPEMAILVKQDVTLTSGSLRFGLADIARSHDALVTLASGVELALGPQTVVVEARYAYGVADYVIDEIFGVGGFALRNRSLGLTVGIKL